MDENYIGVEKGVDMPVDIEGLRENTSVYCLSAATLRKMIYSTTIEAVKQLDFCAYRAAQYTFLGFCMGVCLMIALGRW